MHSTKNTLAPKVRQQTIDILDALVVDAVDLYTQLKQAHWNVKGPAFIALHELFDEIAKDSIEWGDVMAERIVQLGGTANGTARVVAKSSSLKEYPLKAVKSSEHVGAVGDRLAAFGASMRKGIDACDKAGDKDAADICTGISRSVDKYLWFVESHQQNLA